MVHGTSTRGTRGTWDIHSLAFEVAHMVSSAIGELETVFKRLTKNDKANFKFTKRHDRIKGERVPWFCLIGAIANGGVSESGEQTEHETIKIGSLCKYMPLKSGYFYAYANDAWNFYENNWGSVTLRGVHERGLHGTSTFRESSEAPITEPFQFDGILSWICFKSKLQTRQSLPLLKTVIG